MDTSPDLLKHNCGELSQTPLTKTDMEQRIESAVKNRYGSALKPRYCNASFGDVGLADRHERMNKEVKRMSLQQCQFKNSAILKDNQVSVPEQRPMTATTQARNTGFTGTTQKKATEVKVRELDGSNVISEVE